MSPTFAQEVRRLRTERGLSLSQLENLVPYSKGHLSKVENGRVQPNPDLARILDDALQAGGHLVETHRGGSYDLSTANGRKRFRIP